MQNAHPDKYMYHLFTPHLCTSKHWPFCHNIDDLCTLQYKLFQFVLTFEGVLFSDMCIHFLGTSNGKPPIQTSVSSI
jgi:hypothetical protein